MPWNIEEEKHLCWIPAGWLLISLLFNGQMFNLTHAHSRPLFVNVCSELKLSENFTYLFSLPWLSFLCESQERGRFGKFHRMCVWVQVSFKICIFFPREDFEKGWALGVYWRGNTTAFNIMELKVLFSSYYNFSFTAMRVLVAAIKYRTGFLSVWKETECY